MLLRGKVALVTGGASGIGRATALRMAEEGARVLVADRDGEGAARVAETIRQAGGEAHGQACDVTVEAEVAGMVRAACDAWGRLDCAFNNAGVAPAEALPLAEIPPEEWSRVLGVNLTGVFLCLRHQIPAMAAGGGGAIVNTASIAGRIALPKAGAYVAAKHAVIGLTRSAALDHAGQGVRVNAICPGYVETPLASRSIERRREAILARVPLGRIGTVEEIADAVVWLLSDRAGFVTGEALAADGGHTSN
ncbi:SDR family NAD(P)-dependent oxidoreductase [Roseococcus suduntuyensis]|uniref:NAD(P)-dependent dehydrogenase (Short-subunit alcohol dehydrogenase family) n=1 Tax=Roseococcus suduntuyensis TaxID=455361 RepID=A0A840AJV7_9PROT|nr:glucose 1-dehydrogenase [Roseococcus suduntuyensis]MBB3900404.1 NAD(P)-dependent dehydrogenase (short-subunit alcohol dehydrogenase family) [Roseococcus suduntuyensis]